jgi:octaprenyl-diphosphate synthase
MLLPSQTNTSPGLSEYRVPAFGIISSHLDRVRELINEQLTASDSRPGHRSCGMSDELFQYMRSHNGKMIRPALVLLSGACFGDITDEHLRVAAMVEMVHDATLLHDDVIDDGRQRRAKPTVNSIWGNESAVLLGDFLLSRVFRLGVDLDPTAFKIIAAAAVRLCEGELRQIEQKRNWRLNESKYIDIITEKSAVLFSSCCQLGAVLAGANDAQVNMLADFGLNAGIAFQIADDLLDILGDEKQTGKTAGGDLNDNKLTLPVIHLLKTADRNKKKQIKSILEGTKSPDNKKTLVEMLNHSGSIDYTRNRATEYTTAAINALSGISQSEPKAALIETAEFMTNRTI